MLDLSVGSELAGYRVEAIAGRGGMGVVYRATDPALDRLVALKVISDEFAEDAGFRARFKRESRLAASIRHPNVITVFRAGEEDGRLYIAMDYVEGTDLKALIASRGRLEPRLAANVVAQVATALDVAHAKTLVHRDVKPANVLIAGEHEPYHVYLTDFGLTKQTASQSAMTETGVVVGTLDYMAPEQIEGAALDARADIYSLGCVLYEALTGEVPYPRDSLVAKMYAHAREPPPSVVAVAPDIAPQFDSVVTRAMAKNRDERYLSAGDLGQAVLAAADGRSAAPAERSVAAGEAAPRDAPASAHARATELSPTLETTTPRVSRGRRSLVMSAAALLVAGVVAAMLVAGGGGDAPPALSKDQYQDQVLDATRPFTAQVTEANDRLPASVRKPRDAVGAAARLADLRRTTDSVIATLRSITPPEDIADLHRRLIDVFERMRGHVADAGAAADIGNDREYRAAPVKLEQDSAQLDSLAPEFRSRGYRRLGL